MEASIMYLVQMDIIMCGQNLGKNFGKKIFVQWSNMVVAM
jgi:broad specificity polyphosphatase/5'/3'-nucleotidase SurE